MQFFYNGPASSGSVRGREIDADTLNKVRLLLAEGQEIEAIRVYREATSSSLAEAVSAVKQIKGQQ